MSNLYYAILFINKVLKKIKNNVSLFDDEQRTLYDGESKNKAPLSMLHNPLIDVSIPFMLPRFSLRGRLVRLQNVSSKILHQHAYPFPIAKILAEFLVAGAALAGLLKFKGVFTLQTKTNGPLNLTVIDVTDGGHMRGYAQFNPEKFGSNDTFKDLLGQGYLGFTIDQGLNSDRYQGIVSLNHDGLSQALEHYFDQSEQLATRLCIASEKTREGTWKSSALLLQQLPTQNVSQETWTHIDALLNTLFPEEFLDFSIPCDTLLTRLFHEGSLTVFDPLFLKAQCRCSKERIRDFLATLIPGEIEALLEKEQLKMTCEFCNHRYTFNRKDIITLH